MTKDSLQPTAGQLERDLAQKIQALYRDQLEHQPSKVICQIFSDKLAVIIEDVITQPEKLLNFNGNNDLAEQIRTRLDEIIQPQLKGLVEETLQVSVIDILSDSTLETGRGGMIVILAQAPHLRGIRPNIKGKNIPAL